MSVCLYVIRCQEPILKLRNNFPDLQLRTAFLLMTEDDIVPTSRIIQTLGTRSLLRPNIFTAMPKVLEYLVRKYLHVTHLATRIFRWVLNF